jgi:hypothetical protein
LSRSSKDIGSNESPKILLTASRERLERSVTVDILCDEDHIPDDIAGYFRVTHRTTTQFALLRAAGTTTPILRRGGVRPASAIG